MNNVLFACPKIGMHIVTCKDKQQWYCNHELAGIFSCPRDEVASLRAMLLGLLLLNKNILLSGFVAWERLQTWTGGFPHSKLFVSLTPRLRGENHACCAVMLIPDSLARLASQREDGPVPNEPPNLIQILTHARRACGQRPRESQPEQDYLAALKAGFSYSYFEYWAGLWLVIS